MSRRSWLLAGTVGLIVVVTAAVTWRACRPTASRGPAPPAADFVIESADLESPDMELELISVTGTARPGYTDFACLMVCRERRGCRADVEAVVHFRSGGERRTLKLAGRFDAAAGEAVSLRRAQRPAVPIDRIDRVVVTVEAPVVPVAPRPTPMM